MQYPFPTNHTIIRNCRLQNVRTDVSAKFRTETAQNQGGVASVFSDWKSPKHVFFQLMQTSHGICICGRVNQSLLSSALSRRKLNYQLCDLIHVRKIPERDGIRWISPSNWQKLIQSVKLLSRTQQTDYCVGRRSIPESIFPGRIMSNLG